MAEHWPPKCGNINAGRAGRLRMSKALRPEGNGVPSGGTDVLGIGNGVSLDEDTMTFGKHELSAEGKRRVSTTRVREFRKRQKLRLVQRTIRISQDQVGKLVALGYLGSRGDAKAEAIAIEAYLGDNL
jgi:hypothetical protein